MCATVCPSRSRKRDVRVCLFTRALGLGGLEVYVAVEIEYHFSFFSS